MEYPMDPTSIYRAAQASSSSPASRVVLLLQGAVRFGNQHLVALERQDREASHTASLRAQAIVSALREVLDLSAGPIATQLDALYDFTLARLVDGNIRRDPAPTREALTILRELLSAWEAIAGPAARTSEAPFAVPAAAAQAGTTAARPGPVLAAAYRIP
jgi:flagellar secretion chaperone FliS